MSDFVYRCKSLLMLSHTQRFLLISHDDFLDRFLDHPDSYTFLTFLTCEYSSFIEKIAELSSRESDRDGSDLIPVHISIEWLALRMYFEDLLAIFEGWETDGHTSIESSWSQKCLIEDIGAIGRCHDDDIGIIIESVHLGQDLIQGLLTLIMSPSDTRRSLLPDSIDLIDEYDRRGFLTSFFEKISYTGSTDSDEHLDELRSRNREKWNFRFSGDCTSKESLPGTRRSLKEYATWDLRTKIFVLHRIFEEVDDLDQICFLFVRSCDIRKCHLLIHLGIIDLRS